MNKCEGSTYANFHDPGGLLLRMLKKASYESVWPLLQVGATVAAKPLDKIAARWERLLPVEESLIPQILIVGPPRSGTTLASQVLTKHLNVSYFPNVSALFPNAPIWISKKWLGRFDQVPDATRSFYGNTTGLHGINDGFHLWNRWLGKNRYRIDHQPTAEEEKDLTRFFFTWNASIGKPLLNKNNRNADGIELLSKLLPNAYFVVVQRDCVATVQSLLAARLFIQGSTNQGWGLYSDQLDFRRDAIEATCRQVVAVHLRIRDQLARLSPDRYLEICYADFCGSPIDSINRVIALVPGLQRRPATREDPIPKLTPSSIVNLARAEQQRIEDTLARLQEEAGLDCDRLSSS